MTRSGRPADDWDSWIAADVGAAAAHAAKAGGSELRLRAVPHSLARLLRLTCTRGAFTIEQQ
ncbi:hypothetical protein [Streptomyces scopuliridis]|uniref:hypothetical protein n=1 Tax=Streptomyces scopuliridis TaxID=452529 RepID=UPI00341C964E